MGLFDRLFGRKEETKPQTQDLTEEIGGSEEEASSPAEPVSNKPSQSDEAKISAMEAYYAELKERMAAESARASQESKASSEKVPLEEPVNQETAVEKEAPSQIEQETSPEEVTESAPSTEDQTSDAEALQEVSVDEEHPDSSSDLVQEALEEEVLVRTETTSETSSPFQESDNLVEEEPEGVPELDVVREAPIVEEEIPESSEEGTDELEVESLLEEATSESDISEEVEEESLVEESTSEPEIVAPAETVQEKYNRSLKKTRTGFGAALNTFFANFRSVDEDFFEELEELLIMSDVGVQVA